MAWHKKSLSIVKEGDGTPLLVTLLT